MIWAIGDLQGCYEPFMRLLDKIDFKPKRDRLWLTGDLVNRGNGSREVLDFVYAHRKCIDVVLGNHDLSLLAVWWGIKKSNPTIDPILSDRKAKKWIKWLRSRPFLQVDYRLGYIMAHAGIPPSFELGTALYYDRILRQRLRSKDAPVWLAKMIDRSVDHFDPLGGNLEHERYALGGFTRMRFCHANGYLDFDQKGAPAPAIRQKGLYPWFVCPARKKLDQTVIFGHWSTLGFYKKRKAICLDSGCVWRGKLTALRLDGKKRIARSVKCPEGIEPKG